MYADSKCSCFFVELVNALVMAHPLYFDIVPGFSDNVIVSYSESTVCFGYPLCVVVVGCQAERSEIEIWDFKWKLIILFVFSVN